MHVDSGGFACASHRSPSRPSLIWDSIPYCPCRTLKISAEVCSKGPVQSKPFCWTSLSVLVWETGSQVCKDGDQHRAFCADNNSDEVLYHARVHPEQRANSLSESQIRALHEQIRHVCTFAVEVNADDTKFPDDWLFKYRWVSIRPVLSCISGRAFDVSVCKRGRVKK